jgi:quaternary ammonium compound-resistance protein SugE
MNLVKSLPHLNPWLYLVAAGVFEMGFTSFMKLSNGFQRWGYNVCFAICALLSFGLLNLSTRELSLGTAYAVWTGIGAVGAFVTGVLLFGDSASALRIASILLIVAGIIGLKLA